MATSPCQTGYPYGFDPQLVERVEHEVDAYIATLPRNQPYYIVTSKEVPLLATLRQMDEKELVRRYERVGWQVIFERSRSKVANSEFDLQAHVVTIKQGETTFVRLRLMYPKPEATL